MLTKLCLWVSIFNWWPSCAIWEGGLLRGENVWLRLTTASAQCLRLSERFFSFNLVYHRFCVSYSRSCYVLLRFLCRGFVDRYHTQHQRTICNVTKYISIFLMATLLMGRSRAGIRHQWTVLKRPSWSLSTIADSPLILHSFLAILTATEKAVVFKMFYTVCGCFKDIQIITYVYYCNFYEMAYRTIISVYLYCLLLHLVQRFTGLLVSKENA